MKLRKIKLKNVRSFLEEQTLELSEEISIIIGPNGGGKTNLLDTAVLALRIHLLKSWIPHHTPIEGQQERFQWVNNDGFAANLLEKHSTAATEEQRIDLTIEVTPTDVDSMALAKKDASALQEKARYKYVNIAIAGAANWKIDEVVAGTTYTYSIVNGQLTQVNLTMAERAFMEYLQNYEVHNRVREEFSELPLSTPMIFLPVTRSSGDMSASVTLAYFNEQDHKRTVDAASSRSASAITTLAVGRYLRNVRGLQWNHKRVYGIYRELELNLRIKPRKRLVREKPEPLSVPQAINEVWSMDFMHDQLEDGRSLSLIHI